MRDARILILTEVLRNPNKPLKVYIEIIPVARATFFSAKAELLAKSVLIFSERKQLTVDHAEALRFLAETYPGMKGLFDIVV